MKLGRHSTTEFGAMSGNTHFAAGCHNLIAIGYSLAMIGMGLSIAVVFVN